VAKLFCLFLICAICEICGLFFLLFSFLYFSLLPLLPSVQNIFLYSSLLLLFFVFLTRVNPLHPRHLCSINSPFFCDFTFAQKPFIFINFYPKPAKTVHFNEIIFRRFQKIIKNERFLTKIA